MAIDSRAPPDRKNSRAAKSCAGKSLWSCKSKTVPRFTCSVFDKGENQAKNLSTMIANAAERRLQKMKSFLQFRFGKNVAFVRVFFLLAGIFTGETEFSDGEILEDQPAVSVVDLHFHLHFQHIDGDD